MDLNSPLASAIISALVSFFVGLFFSDKSVERSQIRRLHSVTLQSSLETWVRNIDDICQIGKIVPLTKYSHEEEKIMPIEIGDGASAFVPHYQFLERHMKSGYREIWDQWKGLIQQVQNHNTNKAELLEDIRQQFLFECRELNLLEYYHKPGRSRPRVWVSPDMIAESIFDEIKNRISGMENWWGGKPKITETHHGDTLIYGLKIFNSRYMIDDTNRNNVSFCIKFILSKVEDEGIITIIEQLQKMYDINYSKASNIKDQINVVISTIELGQNIKGKCKYCPKFLWIF